jgi:biopolymer transport protein ExbD
MAISYKEGLDDDADLSEINTTPLVDVMLVLLIIFLITIPVINTSVAVRLPREANQLRQSQPETALVSIDAAGVTYWFDARLTEAQSLQEKLQQLASRTAQPEVHIRADARADYEAVAKVLYACQQAGIVRVGFVTDPASGNLGDRLR